MSKPPERSDGICSEKVGINRRCFFSTFQMQQMVGADAFLTGEASEPTVHFARENGLHFFAAGHHATERDGVQALGAYLSQQFGLRFTFIDINNPV